MLKYQYKTKLLCSKSEFWHVSNLCIGTLCWACSCNCKILSEVRSRNILSSWSPFAEAVRGFPVSGSVNWSVSDCHTVIAVNWEEQV